MRQNRINPLVKNTFFNLLSWGGNALINLVSIPVIIYFLGVEGFGIYALLTGLVGYYSLLDLGLGQGVTKFVAEFSGRNDANGVVQAMNAALISQLAAGFLGLAALTLWNREIVALLKISSAYRAEASLCLYICSFGFFITMVMGTFSSALLGLQKFDTVGKVNLGFSIATTLSLVAGLALGGGLVHIILLTVALALANCFALVFLVRRHIPQYRFSVGKALKFFKPILTYSGYLFLLRLSSVLNTYFIRFIVGAFWGPLAVSYFVVPMKLVSAVQGGLGSLAGVLFPHASDLFARGRMEQLRHIYTKSSRYIAAMSTPVFLFLIFFSEQIMRLWMSDEFARSTWLVLSFLSVAQWLAVLTMIPSNVVMGIGKSNVVAAFSTIVALLNVLFVFALTQAYGATGAAAGIAITAIQGPLFIWYVTRHALNMQWNEFASEVFGALAKPSMLLSFGCVTVLLVEHQMLLQNPFLVVTLGIALLVLYVVYLFKGGILRLSEMGIGQLFSTQVSEAR